ncbi:MAG: hypothetical protein HRT94_05290 [Alphaproteobacteria bacterium]|nr:hypothetical protein [Alphaproteobacteria bacterium]
MDSSAENCDFLCTVLPCFFEGLGVFAGVFAGIFAGTVISLLINRHIDKKSQAYAVRALNFELQYNIGKVDGFLEELSKYKTAVVEGHVSMSGYYGFFRFSDIFSAASVQLYQNGFLAEHLSVELVAKLQDAIYTLSATGQPFINNSVERNRVEALEHPALWETTTKQRALDDIRYWNEKFEEHKKSFQDVIDALPKKNK